MHHFCRWHFFTCTFILLAAPCNAPLLSVFRGRFYPPVPFITSSYECTHKQILCSNLFEMHTIYIQNYCWACVIQESLQNHKMILQAYVFDAFSTLLCSYSTAAPSWASLSWPFWLQPFMHCWHRSILNCNCRYLSGKHFNCQSAQISKICQPIYLNRYKLQM